MTDAYRAALDELYGRLNYERTGMPMRSSRELRVGRMRRLLQALDDPQDAYRIIHVAGTKGKGSTSAMAAAALTASGSRTGLFCSPHLHRLEERFRVDGREIEPEGLVELLGAVRPAVERLDRRLTTDGGRLTFFEITTAMGLLHFAREKAAAAVVEVGLGGRLDSTNAVRPEVAVITTISFDHTKQLGSTLDAIAREKAGILKRGRAAVVGVREPDAAHAIAQVASSHKIRPRWVDHDYRYTYEPPEGPIVRPDPGRVRVRSWRSDWGSFTLPLMGEHQALNAATALAAVDAFAERTGTSITADDVAEGFRSLSFPARIEILGERPWLVVDGAHNTASAQALARALTTCFPRAPRTLVFGTSRDKDTTGQLRILAPHFDRLVATRYLENPRSTSPEEVAGIWRTLTGAPAIVTEGPGDALATARAFTPPSGLICITGSLFLAAECRAILLEELRGSSPSDTWTRSCEPSMETRR